MRPPQPTGPADACRRSVTRILTLAGAASLAVLSPISRRADAAQSAALDVARPAPFIAELQRFWASTLPRVYGKRFVPVPAANIIAWRPGRSATICGEFTSSAELADGVADNAVGGVCDDDRTGFVVWDARPNGEIIGLARRNGRAAFAAVIAHEFGHVVQGQLGYVDRTRTIFVEQQADCFAGAFFARKLDGKGVRLGSGDFLSPGVIALMRVRDPVGTDPNDENAHGSGFDRLRAFQDGLTDGVRGCKAYARRLPKLFETPFDPGDDGRPLPLADLLPLVTTDLNRHFAGVDRTFPPLRVQVGTPDAECSTALTGIAACPVRGTVVVPAGAMRTLQREIGDGAVAALLAMGWSESRAMRDTATAPADRATYDACRAGAWFRSVADSSASDGLSLSSGDVDEALQLLLRTSSRSATGSNFRTSFLVRALAFRVGVSEPRGECRDVLDATP